jgi:hypothetical protein
MIGENKFICVFCLLGRAGFCLLSHSLDIPGEFLVCIVHSLPALYILD